MNTVTAVVLFGGVVILALQRLGWLPESASASFWRERAETAMEALKAVTEERDELVATRTLEPILETLAPILRLVESVLETQQQTLDKLASFNGSLRHVEDGLRDASEGMKALTGTIAELHGIPLHPPEKEA